MDCPACQGELVETVYEDFPIYRCSKCGGYWVKGDILTDIIEKRKIEIPDEALKEARNWKRKVAPNRKMKGNLVCPVCGRNLIRRNYAYDTGIVIDCCSLGCGIWLDAKELVAVQAFDEVWDKKALEIFNQKGLGKLFEEKKAEDELESLKAHRKKSIFGRSIIGRLADFFMDFMD